jgi:type II secretory pathway component PulF
VRRRHLARGAAGAHRAGREPALQGCPQRHRQPVNEGSSLADAVARYPDVFLPLFINMVRAGEASGSLETVLLRIADFMDQQEELKGKVTSAMIYPMIMTVLSAASS